MISRWRWLAIGIIAPLGILYAAPNLYPPEPAVQLGWSASDVAAEEVVAEVRDFLADTGYADADIRSGDQSVTVVLADGEQQLSARQLLADHFGGRVVAALNLAEQTPDWLTAFGASEMKLGLDLRGGVRFMLEVDRRAMLADRMNAQLAGVRRLLRENRIRWRNMQITEESSLRFEVVRAGDVAKALEALRRENTELAVQTTAQPQQLQLSYEEQVIDRLLDEALEQNLTALRNRVDALGVAEAAVRQEGQGRVAVELPGIQDTAAARRIIGRTATLEFRLEADAQTSLTQTERFAFRDGGGEAQLLDTTVITGENVVGARPAFDQNNLSVVSIELDAEGGNAMFKVTRDNIGRRMGAILVESAVNPVTGVRAVKREILTLPVIRGTFGSSFQIEGVGSVREASELALLLRSGALAAPMNFLEERIIGPTLGAENISRGVQSVLLGLALVALLMLARYRFYGLIANLALVLNLVLVVAWMSLLGATLTLPGIAGLVLTVGMAVDANVLIFERIREELRAGRSPLKAVRNGYDQALVTIIDANLTTLLAAVILYAIGTGPIRGFAVTLSLGILTSMFTAVTLTRALAEFRLTLGNWRSRQRPA